MSGGGIRRLSALAALFLVCLAVAASLTVPATRSGDGAGGISGYRVSDIRYVLDGSDPASLSRVEFSLDDLAGEAAINLQDSSGAWHLCSRISGNLWRCQTSGQSVAAATALRVVAVQRPDAEPPPSCGPGDVSASVQGPDFHLLCFRFGLDQSDPRYLSEVRLTFDQAPATAQVQLSSAGSYGCTKTGAYHYACSLDGLLATSVDRLLINGVQVRQYNLGSSEGRAQRAQEMAPPECAPIRSSLADAQTPSGGASYSGAAAGQLVLVGTGTGSLTGSSYSDCIVNGITGRIINAGSGDDVVVGGAGNEYILGGSGNDVIYGGPGNDALRGGDGADLLYGGEGGDYLDGQSGADACYGGSGADYFHFSPTSCETAEQGGEGAFYIMEMSFAFSGSRSDLLTGLIIAVDRPVVALQVMVDSGTLSCTSSDSVHFICSVSPSLHIDSLTFLQTVDSVVRWFDIPEKGRAYGCPSPVAADLVNRQLITQTGVAVQYGYPNYLYIYSTGTVPIISVPAGSCLVDNDAAHELRGGNGPQALLGRGGNDTIYGDHGVSSCSSSCGDDIRGGDGNDTLLGQLGNDVIYGGPGDDSINGGDGYDICYGGPGNDTFIACEEVYQD